MKILLIVKFLTLILLKLEIVVLLLTDTIHKESGRDQLVIEFSALLYVTNCQETVL